MSDVNHLPTLRLLKHPRKVSFYRETVCVAHGVSQGSVGSAGFGPFVRQYITAAHKAEEHTHLTMARKLEEQAERASSHYPLSGPGT